VLLAYTKSDLVAQIVASPLTEDPSLASLVAGYVPDPVRQVAGDLVGRHRLYRDLAATSLAGLVVDHMGITWAHETAAELGRTLEQVAGAWWAAWQLMDAAVAFAAVAAHGAALSADDEAAVHAVLAGAVGTLARAYLVTDPATGPQARIDADGPVMAAMAPATGDGRSWEADKLAAAAAEWAARSGVADVALVQRATGRSVAEVTAALAAVDAGGGAAEISAVVAGLAPGGRWARWQLRALQDDLDRYRRRAAQQALASLPDRPAEAAVGEWLGGRQAAIAAARQLRPTGQTDHAEGLAGAALAVRFLTEGLPAA
jgi:glutamate dehydrogenase